MGRVLISAVFLLSHGSHLLPLPCGSDQSASLTSCCMHRHPHDMPLLIITGHPVMQPPTIHSPTHSSIRPKRKRLGVDDLIGPGKPQCGVGRWMRAVVEHGPQAFSVRNRRGHGQHTYAVHYNYTAHTHARTPSPALHRPLLLLPASQTSISKHLAPC